MQQIEFPFINKHIIDPRSHQSEAERQFLLGFVRAGWLQQFPANDNGDSPIVWTHGEFPTAVLASQINLEFVIGVPHTADYCVRVFSPRTYNPSHSLVLEVDGHLGHSTARDRAADKRIDRAIQSHDGWRIFRFPASEVFDSRLCDQHVRSVHQQLLRWTRPAAQKAVRHQAADTGS